MNRLFRAVLLAMIVVLVLGIPVAAATPEPYTVYAPFGCVDCNMVGSGQLVRSANGVSIEIQTTGLDHAAYTVWWIVFNNPAACVGGCDGPDLDILEVNGSVLWATGHVVGPEGKTTFAASLQEGNPKGQVLFGNGLTDAAGAEIHLVVRSHGPPIPKLIVEQTTTFSGGCDINVCEDQQFAIPD